MFLTSSIPTMASVSQLIYARDMGKEELLNLVSCKKDDY